MVDAADVQPGQTVLEIGPGTGNTYGIFAGTGAPGGCSDSIKICSGPARRFEGALILAWYMAISVHFNLTELPAGYKVVANIPYYLTSHLVQLLVKRLIPPVCAVLLIRRK